MPVETLNSYFHGSAVKKALNCEANRLKTFEKWDVSYKVSACRLANAGFFSTGNGDEVECFSCGLQIRDWTGEEKPKEAHLRRSPRCPMFGDGEGPAQGAELRSNVPLPVKNSPASSNIGCFRRLLSAERDENLTRNLTVYLGQHGIQPMQGIAESTDSENGDIDINIVQFPGVTIRPRRRRNNNNNLRVAGIPTAADGVTVPYTARCQSEDDEPLYPDYAPARKRRNSFWEFPVEKRALVEPMCRCGFFYTGYCDAVVCYACGLSLQDWRVAEDDPRLVHARWRPACPRMRMRCDLDLALFAQRELQVVGL